MDKGQFAILRFAKYKGPEICNIEAHNERTKEKYASNPDVDTNRSKNNFHIIQPTDKYRAMSEALIKQYDVACLFQLFERFTYGIYTLLADCRQSSRSVVPLIGQGQHHG